MIGLTPHQAECLAFIKAQVAITQVCPSYQEIARHLGMVSKSGVHRLVVGLEARGHIKRHPRIFRSIEIVEPKSAERELGFHQGLAAAILAATKEPYLDEIARHRIIGAIKKLEGQCPE